MLFLSRRIGEKIVLGKNGEITILVSKVQGNQVSIGVEAPTDIPIHRLEVANRIKYEGKKERTKQIIETKGAELTSAIFEDREEQHLVSRKPKRTKVVIKRKLSAAGKADG